MIHFYRAETDTPLFLITIFAKNVQENLTVGQTAEMAKAAAELISTYRRKE